MCRLSAITASEYTSVMEAIMALDTMKEGHDGSGLGVTLHDLGGEFESLKEYPILSGICNTVGHKKIDDYMEAKGFKVKFMWEPQITEVPGSSVTKRGQYLATAYQYPDAYIDKSDAEKATLLMQTRLELRRQGEEDGSLYVFTFWPDVLTLKEVGDPLEVGEFFGFDKEPLMARTTLAQGRQNTNYAIYLYACHPFFLEGYCTMTNGENTAFVPNRDYLLSRDFDGYNGYNSDSEVFCHIMHFMHKKLGYPIQYYKDVITPLKDIEIAQRPEKDALLLMKRSLRQLCIDGPNCVIGFMPDGTVFMTQDSKKLRPGIIGGEPGKYALMSEECGVDQVVPNRNKENDIIPMRYDFVTIAPGAQEVQVWNQLDG
ncbi:MAG: glutamate synthase [Desulfobulbaceae bacterium]|nr:glutamate synthase [Desulfobulbaceae bacterium]